MAVTGTNFVRFSRHGLQSIRSWWSNMADRFEVRRQSLKLRFWDERHLHPPGMLLDHSYEGIKALAGEGIYELRVDDEIGGHDNIRVVFFDPPRGWSAVPEHVRPMPVVCVIEALQKKRQGWTTNDLTRFRGQRLIIKKRFYDSQ
jgi:hypothetical protein